MATLVKKEAVVKKTTKANIDFGSKPEPKIIETQADETDEEDDDTPVEAKEEVVVEVAEVVSPKRVLRQLSDQFINQLTVMGLIPPSAEEFIITVTAEDDDEVEVPIKVARDPKGFVESIYEILTSGSLKKEDAKKFFEKVAKFAAKHDYQVDIADAIGKALAYFMISDNETKFNRLLIRLDKFESTADAKFKMLAMSCFTEHSKTFSQSEAENKAVADLVDDSM